MSVKGTLENLGLEQLLQAELSSQGDGRLILRNGAHYAAIHMTEDGAYVVHPDLLDAEAILQSFADRGILDPEVMAASRRSHLSDVLLLDSLVEEGHIPEDELMETLAAEAEDTFLDLMLWEEGRFLFERGGIDPSERGLLGRICVDPEGVCTRARERIDERAAIAEVLGQHALLFIARAGELPPLEGPTDISHLVYARLNGVATTHELALQLRVGRFDVLRAVARLTAAGLARPARPDELVQQATKRADDGQDRVARALVLQWAEIHPKEEGPLRKLASLAATARDSQAETEALCALGSQFLQKGDPKQALEIFQRAMRKAPADDVVMAGMKLAAEAAGDNDSLVDGTLLVAQTKLDEGEADEALELILPLLDSYPDNMGLHLMRARALVMLDQRTELLEQAEIVGQVLGREGTSLTQVDKEAVEFFKIAIADVAPDRGDLLERFRSLYDPVKARRRRMAIGFAMMLILASAGVYFWPASAATLLQQAQEAANAGDKTRAGTLIAELSNRFPESPELEEAIMLQNRLFPPHTNAPRTVRAARELSEKVEAQTPAAIAALEQLPATDSQAPLRTVQDLVQGSSDKKAVSRALKKLYPEIEKNAARLNQEAVDRAKMLAQVAGMHEEYRHDAEKLGAYMQDADTQRDATWIADVRASAELLKQLTQGTGPASLPVAIRELERSATALEKTAAFYDEHAESCRQTLAGLEIEEADRLCREEAPKLMVGGRLEQADALYQRLEALIERYQDDETYAKLMESLERRQIPSFIAERRAQIADIRTRLGLAQQAEDAGNLEVAVDTYARLIRKYWLIRFENVFTIPLQITTVPTGATVKLNGEVIGHTPTIVRYAWGSESTLHVASEGWDPITRELLTAEENPPAKLHLKLAPAPTWRCQMAGSGAAGALRVGDHVLRVDRNGKVSLHDGRSGDVSWARKAQSIEGVRGRPAATDEAIYIPRVDGKVDVLDPTSGTSVASLSIPRPVGHMAAGDGHAAVATSDGNVVAFRGRREAWRASLGAVPTAGLEAGHGAFWAGTARGTLVRVDARTGKTRTQQVGGSNVPIASLLVVPEGVVVTTANGRLVMLDAAGGSTWRVDTIGDIVGTPARAAGRIAVATRNGKVHLFDVRSGRTEDALEVGKGIWHGLLGSGDTLLTARADGSVWAYNLAHRRVIADVAMGAGRHVLPMLLDDQTLVLGVADGCMAVVPMPSLPPEPKAEADDAK